MISFKWGHFFLLFDQSIDCLFVQYWYSCFAPCIRKFGRISWLAFFLHGTKQNVRSQFCPFTGWLSKVYEMIHSVKDISTAAVVTAVTLSMATMYIIFGSKILPKSSKRKLRGPRGLVNPQRSCYMNAVWVWLQKLLLTWNSKKRGCTWFDFCSRCRLQAFASSETIQNWLRNSRPSPLKQGLLKWWVLTIYWTSHFHNWNTLLNF